MLTIPKATIRRVKRRDRVARAVITLGGMIIIASVIAILLLIVWVTLPLFTGARATAMTRAAVPPAVSAEEVACLGIDRVELEERGLQQGDSVTGYVMTRDGTVRFFDFSPRSSAGAPAPKTSPNAADHAEFPYVLLGEQRAAPPGDAEGQTIVSVTRAAGSRCCLLWSDGSVSLVEPAVTPYFDEEGRRKVRHGLKTIASVPPEGDAKPLSAVMEADEGGSSTCVKLLPGGRLVVLRQVRVESLLGDTETKRNRAVLEEGIPGRVTAIAMDQAGRRLFAGTGNGCLLWWRLDDDGKIVYREVVPAFRDKRAITALAMVFGDVALAVGDEQGRVTSWFEVGTGGSRRLRLVHRLSQHRGAVAEIIPSQRNKALMSRGENGTVHLDYTTSKRRLVALGADEPVRAVGYAPRGNAAIALTENQELAIWEFDWTLSDHSHPEVSWGTLLGKVHYENYDTPEYVWQSSGTDEPKFSLVPVIFGTFKSTIYAMLFAAPLALFSAMYVSHFTMPAFKRAIKPVVEVMAAVPTVVIGFLILLWAAPLVGRWIVGVFVSLLTIPVTFVIFMLFWQLVRRYDWAKWVENGYEFLVLVPVIVLGVLLAMWLTAPLERTLFAGDFRQWLFDSTGMRYDQLNSLVVAFGLGFAVIPIIFSISEDALSSIPYEMTAASLALGASRWQTVWRVILPSASPGIFAAMMIGFGRAVGETMIVFMAAGNTPIIDWSPFNGFRTLSANIAMEVPEAAVNSTHFRLLFLCAVILFLLTFLLNTAAEVVRIRLRKKYGQY